MRPHVGEDEDVIAASLVPVEVHLAQVEVEVDQARPLHRPLRHQVQVRPLRRPVDYRTRFWKVGLG